jgi:hypothetical protein
MEGSHTFILHVDIHEVSLESALAQSGLDLQLAFLRIFI